MYSNLYIYTYIIQGTHLVVQLILLLYFQTVCEYFTETQYTV